MDKRRLQRTLTRIDKLEDELERLTGEVDQHIEAERATIAPREPGQGQKTLQGKNTLGRACEPERLGNERELFG